MFLLPFIILAFIHQPVSVYQLQGGNRQTIQTTERANQLQPAESITIQGSQEESDNLQPALGYNALDQNSVGIAIQ